MADITPFPNPCPAQRQLIADVEDDVMMRAVDVALDIFCGHNWRVGVV